MCATGGIRECVGTADESGGCVGRSPEDWYFSWKHSMAWILWRRSTTYLVSYIYLIRGVWVLYLITTVSMFGCWLCAMALSQSMGCYTANIARCVPVTFLFSCDWELYISLPSCDWALFELLPGSGKLILCSQNRYNVSTTLCWLRLKVVTKYVNLNCIGSQQAS